MTRPPRYRVVAAVRESTVTGHKQTLQHFDVLSNCDIELLIKTRKNLSGLVITDKDFSMK